MKHAFRNLTPLALAFLLLPSLPVFGDYDDYEELKNEGVPEICILRFKECEAEADYPGMKARCSNELDVCRENEANRQPELPEED